MTVCLASGTPTKTAIACTASNRIILAVALILQQCIAQPTLTPDGWRSTTDIYSMQSFRLKVLPAVLGYAMVFDESNCLLAFARALMLHNFNAHFLFCYPVLLLRHTVKTHALHNFNFIRNCVHNLWLRYFLELAICAPVPFSVPLHTHNYYY